MATTSESHSAPDDRDLGRHVDGRQLEHQVGDYGAETAADDLGDDVQARRRGWPMVPKARSISVTTGLKWAPETAPNIQISADQCAGGGGGVLQELQSDVVR